MSSAEEVVPPFRVEVVTQADEPDWDLITSADSLRLADAGGHDQRRSRSTGRVWWATDISVAMIEPGLEL
jgi:hypothetical protein